MLETVDAALWPVLGLPCLAMQLWWPNHHSRRDYVTHEGIGDFVDDLANCPDSCVCHVELAERLSPTKKKNRKTVRKIPLFQALAPLFLRVFSLSCVISDINGNLGYI